MATTNAAGASQLHARTASTPQQQQPNLQQPQRSVTISRRQFGPAPGAARPQSTFLASSPTPTNTGEQRSTPPPKSPQSRPAPTSIGIVPNGNPTPSVECPICNISVRNLAQLNQHLDTIHPEEPDDVKSAVSQFFKNAQKVLNPIAKNATTTLKNIPANSSELLRKIQDLDLDTATSGSSLSRPPPSGGFMGWTDPRADSVVTKRHWARESDKDECFQFNCDKGLGIRYGRQHCRCCGNMFCESHSSFQIKLNAQAKHDSDGLWCRVCEGCFIKARKEDDAQHAGGVHRSLTTDFTSIRLKSAEKKHLEVNRLEKRIEKLAQIHLQFEPGLPSSPISPSPSGSLSSLSSGTGSVRAKGLLRSVTSRGQQLKVSEQSIVKWEDDSTVLGCFICLQKADMNQAHPDYQLAAGTRKELLDDFALFDSISKKIVKLPAHTQHQKQLHNNLYWWATQYLQTNMFPLSVIPKVFGNGGKEPKQLGASSPALSSSPAPSISLPMSDSAQDNEAEIESLAQLAVMEEQRRLVESYIEEASRKRKFDDVKSLKMSLEELESEIAAIRSGQRRAK
ncbi:carboxypeptidase Y-deficient [Mortierella sp. AD094]|nr:carboxypeptidase Y-deficient [Mortierella sp. AD094]